MDGGLKTEVVREGNSEGVLCGTVNRQPPSTLGIYNLRPQPPLSLLFDRRVPSLHLSPLAHIHPHPAPNPRKGGVGLDHLSWTLSPNRSHPAFVAYWQVPEESKGFEKSAILRGHINRLSSLTPLHGPICGIQYRGLSQPQERKK